MNILKVKKLTTDATIPTRAHETDSGFDLVAIDDGQVSEEGYIQYKTGLSIEIPNGFDAFIYPRSSISKYDLVLANGVGLIDQGYRGELLVRFKNANRLFPSSYGPYTDPNISVGIGMCKIYKRGDKIAQLVLRERPEFSIEEVVDLTLTNRGVGGFGSSGL